MGLFRRADTRSDVVAVAELVERELAGRGVHVTAEGLDDVTTARLVEPGGFTWMLENLVDGLSKSPRKTWEGLVGQHVASLDAAREDVPLDQMTAEELRARVRSRLLPDVDDLISIDLAYGRPFVDGIIEVLCVDRPATVDTLSGATLSGLPLTMDELFAQGRSNTGLETIDQKSEIEPGIWMLEGESLFVASRAVDFTTLVPSVLGPAPLGVAFSIPDRNRLVAAPLDPTDWATQVNALARVTNSLTTNPGFFHPGGVLSPDVIYWAPDGIVERLGGPTQGEDGTASIAIVPGSAFSARLLSA